LNGIFAPVAEGRQLLTLIYPQEPFEWPVGGTKISSGMISYEID
jgi:hypothetical protein